MSESIDTMPEINQTELVITALLGEVTSPEMDENPYQITAGGQPVVAVGTGGVCYNVRVGMPVFGWLAEGVEPGASIANRAPDANQALNIFACVGNRATVRTGTAAGAVGTVTGKHEGFRAFQHVLVHLDAAALDLIVPGDQIVIRAHGRGMRVPTIPSIACHSLGPELWAAWAPHLDGGQLVARVAAEVPPELIGSGSGRLSAATSVEIQGTDQRMLESAGLDALRLGDLVAIRDWDATYFTGYRAGAVTIGVVAYGASQQLGHGPGVTILLSCGEGRIKCERDGTANLAELLHLG